MNNQTIIKPDNADVVIFPPLLYLITIIVGISIKYAFPAPLLSVRTALISGGVILSVSLVILRLAVIALAKHKTTVNPHGVTTTIVYTGIYRVTRNPMYISFTLFYIGLLIMTNSWFGFLLLIPLLIIVQKGIIDKEEKYLTGKFGETYLNYMKKVNRWF